MSRTTGSQPKTEEPQGTLLFDSFAPRSRGSQDLVPEEIELEVGLPDDFSLLTALLFLRCYGNHTFSSKLKTVIHYSSQVIKLSTV
jgi:hypothetical protein